MELLQTDGYQFCQEVTVRVTPSDAVVVIDDLSYTVREGECIPNSPGYDDKRCHK